MKSTHPITAGCSTAALLLALALQPALADTAEVSEVVAKVSMSEGSSSYPASVGDTVGGKTALKTGAKSRAELTFEDSTLLRVGSNTIFSFAEKRGKGKGFTMTHGTAFIATPKGNAHGGVFIDCNGVTAAITGSSSTVSNTKQGIGMFAATGDNYLIVDGNWIKVEPFTFTFIPWTTDPSGKRIPDLGKMVTKSYDALAQIDSGWVCENLSPELRDRILKKKRELFGNGTLSNTPNQEKGNPIDDITTRDLGTFNHGDKSPLGGRGNNPGKILDFY